MGTKLFLLLVLLNTDIIIVYWYCFQLENRRGFDMWVLESLLKKKSRLVLRL